MEGWLWKYGGKNAGVKSYKRRWFKLEGDTRLSYYKDPTATKQLGMVDLSTISDFRPANTALHQKNKVKPFAPFAMDLDSPTRTFVIIPETESQKLQWIRALTQVLNRNCVSDLLLKDLPSSSSRFKSTSTPNSNSRKENRRAKARLDESESYFTYEHEDMAAPKGAEFELSGKTGSSPSPKVEENTKTSKKKEKKSNKRRGLAAADGASTLNTPAENGTMSATDMAQLLTSHRSSAQDATIMALSSQLKHTTEQMDLMRDELNYMKTPRVTSSGKVRYTNGSPSHRKPLEEPLLKEGDSDGSDSSDWTGKAKNSRRQRSEKQRRRCCSQCTKKGIYTACANTLVFLFGLGVVAASGWALKYKKSFSKLFSAITQGSGTVPIYIALGTGCGLVLVAIVGYTGLYLQKTKRGRFLLFLYFIILFALIICEIVASGFLFLAAGKLPQVENSKIGSHTTPIVNDINKWLQKTVYTDCCLQGQRGTRACAWIPDTVYADMRSKYSCLYTHCCSGTPVDRSVQQCWQPDYKPTICSNNPDMWGYVAFKHAVIDRMKTKTVIIAATWISFNVIQIGALIATWFLFMGDKACSCCKKFCCCLPCCRRCRKSNKNDYDSDYEYYSSRSGPKSNKKPGSKLARLNGAREKKRKNKLSKRHYTSEDSFDSYV